MNDLTPDEIRDIAEEAYIFSFPMLMGYRYGYATFLNPASPSYRGPVNGIYGQAVTLDDTFKDVISPNADTPYSMALLDLRAGPVAIEVPEINDRYYVLQFEDLFGMNVHYVGSRATGTAAGAYLAAGPRWKGKTRKGIDRILHFETDLVFIIGRTQLLGSDDIDALAEVMDGYQVRPLEAFQGKRVPTPHPVEWPAWDDEASRDERFIGYVNFLLSFCQPTHPDEVDMMARFARIGLGFGLPFNAALLDDTRRQALREGVHDAREMIARRATNLGQKTNGWAAVSVFGDRTSYDGDYLLRAAVAMAGWGGNDAIEALYPVTREDENGESLDGAHKYELTFTSEPPARAFWSVTMYDTSYDGLAGYMVKNSIGRYLINATTEGLIRNEDGSLTMTITRTMPRNEVKRANWLPAPDGPFYLILRIYWPEEEALDGMWVAPSVKRLKD